jgi:hypothetical protein
MYIFEDGRSKDISSSFEYGFLQKKNGIPQFMMTEAT